MDPRQQPPLAPLESLDARGEAAAERESFVLEPREREIHVAGRKPERIRDVRPGGRPDHLEPPAHQLPNRVLACPCFRLVALRRDDRGLVRRAGKRCLHHGQPLSRHPQAAIYSSHAADGGQAVVLVLPGRAGSRFDARHRPHDQQRIMELVPRLRIGPGLFAHEIDGGLIELAEFVGRLHIQPAPRDHGLRPALLERGVVEECVRPCVEHLMTHGGRLGRVARDQRELATIHALQHALQPREIHRLEQAIGNRLIHQRVVGDLAITHQVLRARELIGEDGRDQVFGLHTLQRGRHLPAAAEAQHRERPRRVPTPARPEHRRVEHRLHEEMLRRRWLEILEHVLERETVLRPQ